MPVELVFSPLDFFWLTQKNSLSPGMNSLGKKMTRGPFFHDLFSPLKSLHFWILQIQLTVAWKEPLHVQEESSETKPIYWECPNANKSHRFFCHIETWVGERNPWLSVKAFFHFFPPRKPKNLLCTNPPLGWVKKIKLQNFPSCPSVLFWFI